MKLWKLFACCFLVGAILIVAPLMSAVAAENDAGNSLLMGVDVSSWNGTIDWTAASQEIDFAILRIGSKMKLDSAFHRNVAGCDANAIAYGVYYVSGATGVEDALAEAEFVLSALEGAEPTFPVYFNIGYGLNGMPSEELQAVVRAFCNTIEDAGYQAGLYTYADEMNMYFSGAEFADLNKWVSEVDIDQCSYKGEFAMWQYSWSGRVSGFSGDVNCNYYYGTPCDHQYGYSYEDGLHTFTCSVCANQFTKESNDGQKFGLKGASPVLSDDIVMVYETFIPAGFEKAYMVFEFNGETTVVTESEYVASTGRTCFRFPGLNPQKMGDNIHATLYAYVDGYEVSIVNANYSMVQYCDRQLKNTGISAELRTALSDLLIYGEMNQIYEGYKTDALCTSLLSEGAVLTPSTFPAAGVDASWNVQGMTGTKVDDCTFTGVGVTLGAKIVIGLNVTCTDTERFSFKVTIGDMTYDVAGSDLVPTGAANKYVLNFDKITAIQLGETITFTIWEGDTQVSRTATYSVYSYIYKNQNTADVNMANLLKAIYNYGEAVKAL